MLEIPLPMHDLQKNSDPLPGAERPDTEYKHIVEVRARQSFSNIVRREGVTIPEDTIHVSFVTNKRIDMKRTKKSASMAQRHQSKKGRGSRRRR